MEQCHHVDELSTQTVMMRMRRSCCLTNFLHSIGFGAARLLLWLENYRSFAFTELLQKRKERGKNEGKRRKRREEERGRREGNQVIIPYDRYISTLILRVAKTIPPTSNITNYLLL